MKIKDLTEFRKSLNESIKVKNLSGSVTNKRLCNPCGSWIKHWEKLANKTNSGCGVQGCSTKTKIEGGHVIRCDSDDDKHYIIPLCDKHNNGPDGEEFEVISGDLMSAIECKN